ncbi:MAG: DEAD/DEAH box helicase [Bacteroidales bacterium]
MEFKELGVEERLVTVLSGMGITVATDVQCGVIPVVLGGECVVATSQTGSGKSLAYLLPLVQLLGCKCDSAVSALILTPTRELAQQVGAVCKGLIGCTDISVVTIYGGVEYEPQRVALAATPDIIVATPGRLLDLIEQGAVRCDSLRFLILDEMDQMLDLGFRDAIFSLAKGRVADAQTLCFSATINEQIQQLIDELIANAYTRVSCGCDNLAVAEITQQGYYVTTEMMDHLLLHLLNRDKPQRAILFTRSRKMADRLAELLRTRDLVAEAMHSERSQTAREHILERFRTGETAILVATDVVARGIDVADVDFVYNYGMPLEAEQYVHRIGRTGRAGRTGIAITLSPPNESDLVIAACKLMRKNIPMSTNHAYTTPDLQRQITTPTKRKSKRKK